MISNELEPFVLSFKRANIEWKKKYKKYLGQPAQVLSLFGDNGVMLKFENGSVFRFPVDCVKRSEAYGEELKIYHETKGQSKNSFKIVFDAEVFVDEFNLSTSHDSNIKQDDVRKSKGHGWTDTKQSSSSNDDTFKAKKFSMREVLWALNLQDYYKNLLSEGYDSLEYLEKANFRDLIASGMKRGHARRLLRAIKEYRVDPNYIFPSKGRSSQKRTSFCSSVPSPTSSSASWKSFSISRSSIPEYEPYTPNDFEDILMSDALRKSFSDNFSPRQSSDLGFGISRRPSSSTTNFSESQSNAICDDSGYLVIPFTKRPLGFGIMSPLKIGAMISSIIDEGLTWKRLCIGLPLLKINDCNVSTYNVEDVVSILCSVSLPFTITFGLKPYFEPGQKLMVLRNSQWWPCTVENMSHSKVIVKYDGCPFFNNIEKISDYNRLKPHDKVGLEISRESFPLKFYKVPTQTQVSPHVACTNVSFENGGYETQKQSEKSQSFISNDTNQPSEVKRRNFMERQYLNNYTKKITMKTPGGNSRGNVGEILSSGLTSKMI